MRRFKANYTVGGAPTEGYVDIADRIGDPDNRTIRANLSLNLNIPPNQINVIGFKEVFNDAILQDFINTYYGNGSWAAPYWFLGYENATTPTNLIKNVRMWNELGGGNFIDPDPFWRLANLADPLLQGNTPYWNAVIRILLSHYFNTAHPGVNMPVAYVNKYKHNFFLNDNRLALVELSPLPLPHHNGNAPYLTLTNLAYLNNPPAFQIQVILQRAGFLQLQITANRPAMLVCVGMDFRNAIGNILPGLVPLPLNFNGIGYFHANLLHPNGGLTKVFIIPQPAAPGANNNAFFAQISNQAFLGAVNPDLQQLINVLDFLP